MRLTRSIYFNAVQLFHDACTLYRSESFPAAYALSIFAYEELGKMTMVDHVAFEEVLNGSALMTRERMEHLFSRHMFYSHRNKQAWGTYREVKENRVPQAEQRIYDGKLESDKQNAFYVGFVNGRIQRPTRFGASHAYKQLRYVLGAFEAIADGPFYDVTQESSRATRRYAKSVTNELRNALESCTPPRKRVRTKAR